MRFSTRESIGVLGSLSLLLLTGRAPAEQPETVRKNPAAVKSVAEAGNAFAFDLYGRIHGNEGNLFFSPASVSTALAMTQAGAAGETRRQMAVVLHLPEGDQAQAGFSALRTLLNSEGADNAYTLNTANRLWGAEEYPFQESFLTLTRESYGAELATVDFAQSEEARETINEWVSEQTREKIPELIPTGMLNKDTRLVLTNAIYFKGGWDETFDEDDTVPLPFHVTNQDPIDVPTMHQTAHFSYTEDESAQVLAMPYRGGDLSMVIVLPRERDGLAALEESLTAEPFAGWIEEMRGTRLVEVFLPKFTLRSRFDLGEPLTAMGMELAFSKNADFSGISSAEELFLSGVIHEAFVDVDEQGTEAAAATGGDPAAAAVEVAADPPPPIEFRADHPFLFVIRDNRSGMILFMGRVEDPRG